MADPPPLQRHRRLRQQTAGTEPDHAVFCGVLASANRRFVSARASHTVDASHLCDDAYRPQPQPALHVAVRSTGRFNVHVGGRAPLYKLVRSAADPVWAVFLLSIPVAFINPVAAMYSWVLVWPASVVHGRVRKSQYTKAEAIRFDAGLMGVRSAAAAVVID